MRFACSSARSKVWAAVGVGLAALTPVAAGPARGFQFTAAVYDQVKPSVLRVTCSNRSATAFLWQGQDTAVTALHVVAGCGPVSVHYEAQGVTRSAAVVKVLRRADLALLRISQAPAGRPLEIEQNQPSLTEPLSTLGYPLQIPSMDASSLQLRYGGHTLRNIVPDSVAQILSSAGSPSLDLEIDNIEGHLLPGHSGAPIFNQQRRIVAVADGGLENGAASISWGIPVKFLAQLAASSENPAASGQGCGGGSPHVLFAAESEVKNLGELTCSGMTLTKLRTANFTDLSRSVDDPLGMSQIVQFFGINPANFNFDVYQHLPSGATFVLPAGAALAPNSRGDCVTTATGHVQMYLQLGNLHDAGNAAMEANARLQQFEYAWANGPQGWIADPQWTNLMPISRFDGLIVRRRAYTHVVYMPAMFQDSYGFEALAFRKGVYIGLASRYGWTPQFAQHANACRMAPQMAGDCTDVIRFMASWVQSVLAVQLTTFPVG